LLSRGLTGARNFLPKRQWSFFPFQLEIVSIQPK
jgi:hypothetical protein